MNVSLTPQLEAMIREKVDGGMYHSASEVIREALRLLQEHDCLREKRLQALAADIVVGMKQADQGLVAPMDVAAVKAEGRRRAGKRN